MNEPNSNFETPDRFLAVLYFLYQFPDVQDEEHYSRLIQYLLKTHSNEEIAGIEDVLKWGLESVNYSFSDQLPNLRKTNDEILVFFAKLSQHFLNTPEIMNRIDFARNKTRKAE